MQDLEHRLQNFMHHFPGCIYYKVPLQEGSIDRCDPQLSNEPSWSGKSWHDRFRFSFVSGGIATMTGYDPEDYTGGHVSYDLHIHPQEQDWVWGQLQAALDQQQPYQLEYRLKRRDSSWIWVWERGCGVFDAAGQCVGLEGILLDISDRKQVEIDLQRSDTQRQALLKLLPDLVIHMQDDGTYLQFISGGLVQILNQNKMRQGINIYEMLPMDLAMERMRYIQQARLTGEVQIYEYSICLDNEVRTEEARIVALPDAEAMVIIRDITDRKQAEQEIQEQRRFLRCILDTDPNFIFVKDRSGKFVLANQALANFYNTTIEAIIGKTSADFYTEPEAIDRFNQENQMILDLDQPLFIPEEQVPSGPHAGEWLQWQKHPLKIPGKQEPGVLAIGVNITQHKRTEAWQNSKRLALEAIATAAPLGHILALLVNAMEQQCAGVYGAVYVLDSQLQHLRCEVAPHLPPAYLKAVDPLPLDRNIAQESLNRPLHVPQEQIPFLAKTTASPWQKYEDEALAHGFHPCALIPITSSQNSLLGVFGFYTTPNPIIPTLQDWEIFYTVTRLAGIAIEHRQAEQALRDSERNYRDLINNLDAGVLVYDTTGKILLGNYSAAHILGLQPQELQNQTLHTAPWILHDEQGQILTEDQIPFSQVVQTGKAVENHIIRVQQAHRHRMSWILVNAFPKRSTDGTLHQVVVTFTDITQLKQAEDKLRHSSFHDTLTSLPNRALLLEHLDTCIQQTQSGRIPCLAVVFLDLDRFKVINDSLGHLFGDQVLIQVAILLQELVRSDDLVCRFGGDEFVIVLSAIPDTSVGIAKVQKIQAALSQPIEVQDHEVSIAASIGITFSHGEYSRAEDLLRDADIAMYQAKAQGRNCYTVFDQGMHQQAMQRLQLEKDLRLALRSNEMELYYQPIVHRSVDPDRWELEGFEVLVRWNHPRLGLLTPNKFLDLAEETRLILPLNNWVIQRACEQLRHWSHQFPGLRHLRLSVNLAASQLQDVRFIDWLTQTLATTGVSPRQLSLEVTESVLLEDLTEVVAVLDRLRQLGFKISLDDFGTGYSSLNYLQQFPIDILKIDRSFVQGLGIGQSQPQSPSQAPAQLHAQSQAHAQAHAQSPLKFQDSNHDAPNPLQPNHKGFNIIQAIVTLAHALELVVVAEGIENLEEQRLLHSLDCDALQGYYISRPLPQASATQWLAQAQSGGNGNEPVGEAL